MASKIDLLVMNGSNYAACELYMETLLKIKGLWKHTNIVILDQTDDQEKCVIDGKKNDVVGVIMIYISLKILFHLSGIDFHHQV